MKVEFDNSLVTGNAMIDEQHKELIGKIDKLVACCEEGGGKVEAIKMLDYLSDYTDFHFKAEEKLQGNGRVLLRKSGTEPVVRVMAEAEEESICMECVDGIIAVMKKENLVKEGA